MLRGPAINVDNAARKPRATEPAHRGLYLVHSRSWQQDRRRSEDTMQLHNDTLDAVQPQESHAMGTLGLAAAALIGPAVWLGHALLVWKHIL